ncbi:MAG: flagellar hook-length control protein FliK, partial [Methylotenera sp.]
MQKMSVEMTSVVSINKMNGLEHKSNSDREGMVAIEPKNVFEKLLKKQVQSHQNHSAQNASHQNSPQYSTQQVAGATNRLNQHKQPIEVHTHNDGLKQDKDQIQAAEATEEMMQLALLSVPVEEKVQAQDKIATNANIESVNNQQNEQITASVLAVMSPLVTINRQNSGTDVEIGIEQVKIDSSAASFLGKEASKHTQKVEENSDNTEINDEPLLAKGERTSFAEKVNEARASNASTQETFTEVTSSKIFTSVKENMYGDSAISALQKTLQLTQTEQMSGLNTTQSVAVKQTIEAYPGKTGWDQAISQRVVWMVSAGEQSATLTLNPPDLGPLQVVVSVHNGQADTRFTSDNAEVR